MAHIRAQIPDGLGGGLMAAPTGLVHVPEHSQLVAGEMVHQIAQPFGRGIGVFRLDQQRHTLLRRLRQQRGNVRAHGLLVVMNGAGAHAGHAQIGRQRNQAAQRLHASGIAQIDAAVQIGHGKPSVVQRAHSGRAGICVERTAPAQQRLAVLRRVDLHAVKLHVLGRVQPFVP